MIFLQDHAYYGHSVLHWYLPHLFTLRTIMNVRKYLVLGSLALAGCQSPVDDMLNNNFVHIKAEPAPSQIIGFWTGNMGPYLASLSFDKSGNGYFCYSYGTADVIQKVKYSEDTIFIQDGTRLTLDAVSSDGLKVSSNYFGSTVSEFYSDNERKEASEYCSTQVLT